MVEDRALPETDERAVDPMIVVGDVVDESAQPEPKADGDDVVHLSCPERCWSWRAVGGSGRGGERDPDNVLFLRLVGPRSPTPASSRARTVTGA